MEAIILGTAASEGIPALFCGCEACRAAKAAGGKDIRARQSLFLPPDILVDLGPDCLYAVQRFGLDWSGMAAILYTHSHSDHCSPQQLEYVRPVLAHNRTADGLDVYGNEHVRTAIDAVLGKFQDIRVHPAPPFVPIELPNATATPIPSHHKLDGEETLNYIITRDGKSLLCAWDTGTYDDETWAFLKSIRLDGALIECTHGVVPRNPDWPYHQDLQSAVDLRNTLRNMGTLADGAPVAITHFSHNGIVPHVEFEAIAREHGLQVAFDGMRFTV